jgi:hypothetical protein
VHEAAHAADLLEQGVVEALDGARLGAQDGVAEGADVAQRGLAPGALLRGQLVALLLLVGSDLLDDFLVGDAPQITEGPRPR